MVSVFVLKRNRFLIFVLFGLIDLPKVRILILFFLLLLLDKHTHHTKHTNQTNAPTHFSRKSPIMPIGSSFLFFNTHLLTGTPDTEIIPELFGFK